MTEPYDPVPAHSCTGKIAFDSPALAREVAQRSRRKHHAAVQPYRCKHCGKWHVGDHQGGKKHGMVKRRTGNGGRYV